MLFFFIIFLALKITLLGDLSVEKNPNLGILIKNDRNDQTKFYPEDEIYLIVENFDKKVIGNGKILIEPCDSNILNAKPIVVDFCVPEIIAEAQVVIPTSRNWSKTNSLKQCPIFLTTTSALTSEILSSALVSLNVLPQFSKLLKTEISLQNGDYPTGGFLMTDDIFITCKGSGICGIECKSTDPSKVFIKKQKITFEVPKIVSDRCQASQIPAAFLKPKMLEDLDIEEDEDIAVPPMFRVHIDDSKWKKFDDGKTKVNNFKIEKVDGPKDDSTTYVKISLVDGYKSHTSHTSEKYSKNISDTSVIISTPYQKLIPITVEDKILVKIDDINEIRVIGNENITLKIEPIFKPLLYNLQLRTDEDIAPDSPILIKFGNVWDIEDFDGDDKGGSLKQIPLFLEVNHKRKIKSKPIKLDIIPEADSIFARIRREDEEDQKNENLPENVFFAGESLILEATGVGPVIICGEFYDPEDELGFVQLEKFIPPEGLSKKKNVIFSLAIPVSAAFAFW